VIRRTPKFLDPSFEPATPFADLDSHGTNATFGRRFVVVSFRWFPQPEV
jgi:hypothetical protein